MDGDGDEVGWPVLFGLMFDVTIWGRKIRIRVAGGEWY